MITTAKMIQTASDMRLAYPLPGIRTSMVVLWDRDCGFCAFMLALLLRADRRRMLRPAFIQGPEGDRLLADLTQKERLRSWHFVDTQGRRTSGGAALPAMLRELPGLRPLAGLAAARPALTERAYRWVATHRSLLSKPIPAAAKERARRYIEARSK
jgi:predicted DCC family thiol-disulfide oxidoreductase YuxK